MGGFLRDGAWITEDEWEKGEGGEFQRQDTKFRDWIEDAPEARFRPEAGRYHLYVSYACPWAHRTLISRALLGLEDVVSVSVVDAFMGDQGWTFGAEEAARCATSTRPCTRTCTAFSSARWTCPTSARQKRYHKH